MYQGSSDMGVFSLVCVYESGNGELLQVICRCDVDHARALSTLLAVESFYDRYCVFRY